MVEWAAEVGTTAELVRALLEEQGAPISADGLRLLAEGWDNAVWATDDAHVVRMPRRAVAVAGVQREITVLPRLAPLLPLPVPVPVFVGRSTDRYPWPWFAARRIEGEEPATASIDLDRTALAAGLGAFLRVLHAPATFAAAGSGLPEDPMERADMAARIPKTAERLAAIEAAGIWRATAREAMIERVFDMANRASISSRRVLVHGDLHVRHVLVAADGGAAGVIDWGDVCVGDPAIDLSLYWSLWSGAGRRAFAAAYGPLEEGRLARARVLALFLNAALAGYAADVGNAPLLRETLAGLDRTLHDTGTVGD